jgi:hypothetical protein
MIFGIDVPYWVFLVLAAMLLVLISIPFIFVKFFKKAKLNQANYKKSWQQIYELLSTGEGKMLSVIEADKLLDKALLELKIKGSTMGERMVSAQAKFSDPDQVWRAHKLRNKMVHESGFKPASNEIKDALLGFKRGLKDLGAL